MVKEYIKLVRVKQWVKNAFVLAPLLFSFRFTETECRIIVKIILLILFSVNLNALAQLFIRHRMLQIDKVSL